MPIPTRTLPRTAQSHSRRLRRVLAPVIAGLGLAALADSLASAADVYLPIVMPITGFLSVEGGSQRNGAVMALEQAPGGMKADYPIFDTGTSATGAATALDKALSSQKAIAAAVTVFGTEMVAMMPVAAEYKVPAPDHLRARQDHREWKSVYFPIPAERPRDQGRARALCCRDDEEDQDRAY
jgi:hypothetical protein